MMSLTFGLFTQVSDSGPQGTLVVFVSPARQKRDICIAFPALSSVAAA